MRSLAVTSLTLTLGLFFVLVGQFQVTPKFFPDIHESMREEFGRFNKVFPLQRFTGWRPYAKNYRLTVGLTELICGVVLVLIPGRLKQLSNVILLIIMVGAVYTHYALHDPLKRMTPGLVFSVLLLLRLVLSRQGTVGKKASRPSSSQERSTAGKTKLVDEVGKLRQDEPEESDRPEPSTAVKTDKINTPRLKKIE